MDNQLEQPLFTQAGDDVEQREDPILEGDSYLKDGAIVTAICCFSAVFVVYSLDVPTATYEQLRDYFAGTGSMDFDYFMNLVTTLSTFPTIFLPFVLGPLLDKYGMRKSFPFTIAMILFTHATVSMFVELKSDLGVLVVKVVYTCFIQAFSIQTSALISIWLSRHKGFGLGIYVPACRSGSLLNNVASAYFARHYGIPAAFWLSVLFLVPVLIASLMIGKMEGRRALVETENVAEFGENPNTIDKESTFSVVFSKLKHSVRGYPLVFWLVTINFALESVITQGFHNIANSLLTERICGKTCCPPGLSTCDQKMDAEAKATFAMSIPYAVVMVFVPLIGVIIDRIGMRGWFQQVGFFLLGFSFFLIHYTGLDLYLSLVIMGFSFALMSAAIVPSIPVSTGGRDIATAFSVAMAVQAIALTVNPLFMAYLRKANNSYQPVEVLFLSLCGVCFVNSAFINILDYCRNGNLNKTNLAKTRCTSIASRA